MTVWSFTVQAVRPAAGDLLDVDVVVRCSSGTYIRALARDMGDALGVGGHLTRLRRTRVGPYDLSAAHGLDELADQLTVLPLAEAAAAAFPVRELTADAGPLPLARRRGCRGLGRRRPARWPRSGPTARSSRWSRRKTAWPGRSPCSFPDRPGGPAGVTVFVAADDTGAGPDGLHRRGRAACAGP